MAGYPDPSGRRNGARVASFNEEPANGRLSGYVEMIVEKKDLVASMRSRRMAGYPERWLFPLIPERLEHHFARGPIRDIRFRRLR